MIQILACCPSSSIVLFRAFPALIAAKNGVIIHDGTSFGKMFVDK